jgi:quercetin dioxygenase-like cupin family protein
MDLSHGPFARYVRLEEVRVTRQTWLGIAVSTAAAAVVVTSGAAQDRTSRSRTAFSGPLPSLDGQQLDAKLVEVTYPPGGANPTHRHPCPVVGYVLDGAVRMQIQGQPERIFSRGETFFESPSDVHVVSANANADVPARFLAYFVCDHDTPLSVPVTEKQP